MTSIRWVLLLVLAGCGADSGSNTDGSQTLGDMAAPPGSDLSAPPGSDLSTPQSTDMAFVVGSDSFPSTAPWYQKVTGATALATSKTITDHLTSAGWGSLGIDVSFAILHADASVTRRSYTTNGAYYDPDCDHAPVPIPVGGAVENYPLNGYTCGGGDCHLIVFQGTRLYELSVANITGGMATGGTFTGGCLAIWDLTKDYWTATTPYSRGEQCTSADAAGFPMAPLLLTAADINSGVIKHALRFTLDNSLIRDSSYVHPATHSTSAPGGASGGSNTMPYGSRLRLKPGAYPSITGKGQIVVKALQDYGMFMADGGSLFISGTSDLAGLVGNSTVSSLTAGDFEILDATPLTWTGDCMRTPLTN